MKQNAAIYYKPDGYDTRGKRLLGRHSAGEGFLRAFVQSNTSQPLYCFASVDGEFNHFRQLISSWTSEPHQYQFIPIKNSAKLKEVGNLYLPGPNVADFTWRRRYDDQRAYSISGVTHTIASKEMVENISSLLTAPIQPWDALICTSSAVRVAVDKIIHDWQEYLSQRFNATITLPTLQLPIIPLGVETHKFKHNPEFRTSLRKQLNIPEEDIIVLFVGRLIFYGKAHPVPMYLALEKAVQQIKSKSKIHLIQCGWFEDDREEKTFKEGAYTFAPSINHIFVDGRNPQIREQIWSVADMFISLADNIQETFGLTPIEAMSASLPVIVSDWDGYQESVRHEVDGFKISTMIPRSGYALDLARDYHSDEINYSTYIAHASMATMINIDECANAFVQLIDNPDLRQKMGENGRQRAEEVYDWINVIRSYRSLWQELAEIRNVQAMSVPVLKGSPQHPLCDDPFGLFAHYSKRSLAGETKLKLSEMATPESLQKIRTSWITSFGGSYRLSDVGIEQILNDLQANQTLNVSYFLNKYGEEYHNLLVRTLLYLLKFNLIEIQDN